MLLANRLHYGEAGPEKQAQLPVSIILTIIIFVNATLPWGLIWLSNAFLFNIPVWSAEAMLGLSLGISAMVLAANWLRAAHIGMPRRSARQSSNMLAR